MENKENELKDIDILDLLDESLKLIPKPRPKNIKNISIFNPKQSPVSRALCYNYPSNKSGEFLEKSKDKNRILH